MDDAEGVALARASPTPGIAVHPGVKSFDAVPVVSLAEWAVTDMWNLLKVGSLVVAGLVVSGSASSEQLIYSHQFDQTVTYAIGSSQYDDWMTFRASLPESDVMSITVTGSRDELGRTCADPDKAQQIVDAMFAGASGLTNGIRTLSVDCGGLSWNTGACSMLATDTNNLELNVGALVAICTCSADAYTLRPGISGGGGMGTNASWGGIAGVTCNAPTQTMTVTVDFIDTTDTDADGVFDVDDLCPDTAPDDPVDANGCSDAQTGSNDPEPEPEPETVVVNGCDSGVANEMLPSGVSLFAMVNDAFELNGKHAVKDVLKDLRRDRLLGKRDARAIKRCAKHGDDEDDRDRRRGHKKHEHEYEHRHGNGHEIGHKHGRGHGHEHRHGHKHGGYFDHWRQ